MGFMDKLKGAAESVQAQTSKVGVGANAGQMELANRAKKLMNEGVDTPAHIDSMESTGQTDTPGGTENTITLTVSPAGGAAYQVTINQYIYPSAPFAAGDDVTVKVDPSDPNVAMIFGKA
jgi:predicted phage gp36 major capsid-like protein